MRRTVDTHVKWMSRRRAVGLVLAVLLCGPALQALHVGAPMGRRHENRKEIEQIEETWRNAMLQSNSVAMGPLLADDYNGITASGTLETKEKTLADLRTGVRHFTSIHLSERKLRFYGNTVLVTSRADVTGTSGGRDISGSYRYTHVYVRDAQGTWRIVSFEASRIRHTRRHP